MLKYIRGIGCVLVAVLLLISGSLAQADISNIIFQIEATNSLGSDSFTVYDDDLVYNPIQKTYSWDLGGMQDLQTSPVDIIGTLESATLAISDLSWNYPRIYMNLVFQAGVLDVTEVRVRSPLVSFLTLPDGTSSGRATTSFSLTNTFDPLHPGVLAELEGLGDPNDGHGMHTAWYNSVAEPPDSPDGTEWAHLVNYVSAATEGDTITIGGKQPDVGFQAIGDNLYNLSTEVGFSITAGDHMSTNTTWIVMPEPASLGLLALATVVLLRRRG